MKKNVKYRFAAAGCFAAVTAGNAVSIALSPESVATLSQAVQNINVYLGLINAGLAVFMGHSAYKEWKKGPL